MTGFSAEWLALRAPADRRARAPALLTALRRRLARREPAGPLRIVDLGAGTGSTLRLLAPLLPVAQQWTLLDHDAALLAAVRRPAASGALRVRARCANLADVAALPGLLRDAELITSSALFDLVSQRWCRRLLAAAARPGRVLYAALSYDGRLALDPADPCDAAVHTLFDRHQRRDKGFGPALGPRAAAELPRLAAAAGARVRTARSDWRLGPADAALLRPLLAGWASAAAEVAPEQRKTIAAWVARRSAHIDSGRLRVRVGHRDLLVYW